MRHEKDYSLAALAEYRTYESFAENLPTFVQERKDQLESRRGWLHWEEQDVCVTGLSMEYILTLSRQATSSRSSQ